jgi:CRISPR-associated protein Cmr6
MPNLADLKHTTLPKDTKALIDIKNIENFALIINRCGHFLPKKPDDVDENLKKLDERLNGDLKATFFIMEKLDLTKSWSEENNSEFTNFSRRYKHKIKLLFGADENLKTLNMSTAWRMAIGLGGGSVYENGITLHHIYGVPYLPASSVKGVTRRGYMEQHGIKPNEMNAEMKEIFGTDEKQGKVVFLDAFPQKMAAGIVSPDIINNHYQDYYDDSKKKPPADWHSPNPVFFMTLKNVQFEFLLGVYEETNRKFLSKAQEALNYALINLGIGAKTAVGYGLFK